MYNSKSFSGLNVDPGDQRSIIPSAGNRDHCQSCSQVSKEPFAKMMTYIIGLARDKNYNSCDVGPAVRVAPLNEQWTRNNIISSRHATVINNALK